MSKTRVTPIPVGVVDLVRNKPATTFIVIPTYRVDASINVETTGLFTAPEVSETQEKRLQEAAMTVLKDYEKIIVEEARRLDAKIAALAKAPDEKSRAAAQRMVEETNKSIANALASAEGAAEVAMEKLLRDEKQKDKNLTEARAKAAFKFGKAAISLGTAVARLVPSGGLDVSAWLQIAKAMVEVIEEANQQLKDEEALRKDLLDAARKFIATRHTAIALAAKEQDLAIPRISATTLAAALGQIERLLKTTGAAALKGRKPDGVIDEIADFVEKRSHGDRDAVDKAHASYRDNATVLRHSTDAMSRSADAMMKAVKAAKNLKEGVKIGAACMELKANARRMGERLERQVGVLEDIEKDLDNHGLKFDERTTLDKILECDLSTFKKVGEEIVKSADEIKDLVEAVAEAAA